MSKEYNVDKATPRPWKRGGDYRVKGPGQAYKWEGKVCTKISVLKKVVAARENQEYRDEDEDRANIELIMRAVALYDNLPSIQALMTIAEKGSSELDSDDYYLFETIFNSMQKLLKRIDPENKDRFKHEPS